MELTIVDGVKIVVPDSLNLITPYVLLEQQDWFEDEIKFLRHVIRPGQKVIDIGANYGVYTLPIGKVVGPTGSVWAFEPASRTAALLSKGVAANNYTNIIVVTGALSNVCGTAQLSLHDDAELNSIVEVGQATELTETVPVLTLDHCLRQYDWTDIDFVKIDAEGQEANILKGGQTFLSLLSPLIQYEIKAGPDLHLNLVADFAEIGYSSYRLIPGLNLLVPFAPNANPDAYLLNLFCCKQQRAEQLAADGLLVADAFNDLSATARRIEELYQSATSSNYRWQQNIAELPYGALFSEKWEKSKKTSDRLIADDALTCYAISRDRNISAAERFSALEASYNMLLALCQSAPSILRLSSLARVARDFGARLVAVRALSQLVNNVRQLQEIELAEPFLVSSERFDSVLPGKEVGNWFLASALEALEQLSAFSSFYTGNAARERLELIAKLGFGSAEMARRINLLSARFSKPA